MRCIAAAAVLLVLSACAGAPAESPSAETGTVVGEASSPRNRARLHTELASAYYARGNLAVALEELRAATEADADYAPAQSMYGLVYMELRDNKRAEQSFQRALALAPNDGDINHNYGWFLCQTQREPQSIKYFLQAVRNPLYATPARSYSAAGLCALRTNDVKEAENFFQRSLQLVPDDPTSLLQLAGIRYGEGRMEEARRLVSRYNRLMEPTAASLWLALRIEHRLGERASEFSYANQLRHRFPGSPEYQALQRGEFD